MNILKRFAIFALNSTHEKEEHALEWLESQGLLHKDLVGSYKGVLETSYLVVIDTDFKLDLVRKLAKDFNQESILIVDENREARLEYVEKGQVEKLGIWRSISSLEASKLDNWTLDGAKYYGVING